jgi:hypothetical protein
MPTTEMTCGGCGLTLAHPADVCDCPADYDGPYRPVVQEIEQQLAHSTDKTVRAPLLAALGALTDAEYVQHVDRWTLA